MLDIKHIDSQKCVNLTGVPNTNTINFAKYLNEHKIPMWIRQVLVPGYTDNPEDLLKLKEFISTLSNVKKVEILPYHNFGKYKWDNLGLEYPLEGVPPASTDDVAKAKMILEI